MMRSGASQGEGVSRTELRWARADSLVGALLIALGAGAIAWCAVALLLLRRAGEPVHPDAVLAPVLAGVPLLGFGALLRLAGRAMRRGAPGRWTAQGMVLLMPAVLAALVLSSLLA